MCTLTSRVVLLQAVQLNQHKKSIEAYVESRMTFIAPNLSIIAGASTAAKLMGTRHRRLFSGSYTYTLLNVYNR